MGVNRKVGTPDADLMRGRIRIELWRLALPVLWFGMIAAISFIEAPLKFQAPGITIPLGLGIGRLVFAALNIVEAMILLAITLLSFWPVSARIAGSRLLVWFGLLVVFAVKVALVRQPLNARTDLVIAGAEAGQSPWHYIYIACDLATMVLAVVFAVMTARAILNVAVPQVVRGSSGK